MFYIDLAIVLIALITFAGCLFVLSSKNLRRNYFLEIARFLRFLVLTILITLAIIIIGIYFAKPYAQIMDSNWTGVVMGPSVALYILVSFLGLILGIILSCYINYRCSFRNA